MVYSLIIWNMQMFHPFSKLVTHYLSLTIARLVIYQPFLKYLSDYIVTKLKNILSDYIVTFLSLYFNVDFAKILVHKIAFYCLLKNGKNVWTKKVRVVFFLQIYQKHLIA